MADVRWSRRRVLRLGVLVGTLSLAGCGRSGPQLLASSGQLPSSWSKRLPSPWSVRFVDGPAEVLQEASEASLIQLGDGWALDIPPTDLQPIGTAELAARLDPRALAAGRLFAPAGSPLLAFPWAVSPWVIVLRNRPDLARRAAEGWSLLLDPSLRERLVLPASPRVCIALVGEDPARLARLRRQALAYDDRNGLNLLLSGEADAAVLPRQPVVPLLRRDPRLRVLLPAEGAPLAWNLLLRPAGAGVEPPLEWLASILEPPLLSRLLAAGWVPPLPLPALRSALAGSPQPLTALLAPAAAVWERCRSLPPLAEGERRRLQNLWDAAAP
jgi:hypothetical protein